MEYLRKTLGTMIIASVCLLSSLSMIAADTIKIPTHNWSSQLVGAEVVGMLLEKVGEKVEYINMDSQAVYQAMADGDIDLVHEIWEGAFGASYEKAKAGGGIEEILTHDAVTREDWWYPNHVEKLCPGLPDWKALDRCSAKFARAGSGGKGVFIGEFTLFLLQFRAGRKTNRTVEVEA